FVLQGFGNHSIRMPCRLAVWQQIEASSREEHRIDLVNGNKLLQNQNLVLGRPYLVQFFGLDHDVLVRSVLVAADNFGRLDGAVRRTALLVLNTPAAVDVELIELDGGRRAMRGKRFDRDRDQAEAKQSGPTGPSAWSRLGKIRIGDASARSFGDCRRHQDSPEVVIGNSSAG